MWPRYRSTSCYQRSNKVDEKPKEKIKVFGNDEEKKSKSSRFNKKE
jgi:hypothetical protein